MGLETMTCINKFVGIKHKFNGRDRDGIDCLGLCQLFYREHGYEQTWDDGSPIPPDWQKYKYRLLLYLRKHFSKTEDATALEYGDVLLFNIDRDYHLGIYLEYGRILAMQVPCLEGVSQSTIYPKSWWQQSFVVGFKR